MRLQPCDGLCRAERQLEAAPPQRPWSLQCLASKRIPLRPRRPPVGMSEVKPVERW
jgi:hypothetical protein